MARSVCGLHIAVVIRSCAACTVMMVEIAWLMLEMLLPALYCCNDHIICCLHRRDDWFQAVRIVITSSAACTVVMLGFELFVFKTSPN